VSKLSESVRHLGDTALDWIISSWVYITLGLLGLLGMFGKRMMTRIDSVIESHMPEAKINDKFKQVYVDMKSCQKDVRNDMDKVNDNVTEAHKRLDEIYQLLLKERD